MYPRRIGRVLATYFLALRARPARLLILALLLAGPGAPSVMDNQGCAFIKGEWCPRSPWVASGSVSSSQADLPTLRCRPWRQWPIDDGFLLTFVTVRAGAAS